MASAGEVYQIQPMSRIPIRKTTYSNHNHNGTLAHLEHLSPLEKLRIEYQEKLLIEKEKKMSSMYERRNDEALAKVRKYSGKRNYPDTRNRNGSSGMKSNGLSGMKSPTGTSYSNLHRKRMVVSAEQTQDTQIRRPQKLPPINNIKKSSSYHSIRHAEKVLSNVDPQSQHSQNDHINRRRDENHTNQLDTVDENKRTSPPPNTQHLRLLRERRLRQRKLAHQVTSTLENNGENLDDSPGFHAKRKLTDFEKWQQEQVNERFARLQRHHAKQDAFNGNLDENNHSAPVDGHAQKSFGRTRKNVNANPFVGSTASTVRSKSPEIRRDTATAMRKKEILRQAIGKTTRIAELEQEIMKKQMDLRKIQERDSILHSPSSGDNFDERKKGSNQDFQLPNSYAPISKPVKVSSKRSLHDYSSSHAAYDDFEEAELAFQKKPVLVRRDGSQGSSRGDGTPQNDKSHKAKKASKKHKLPHSNKSAMRIVNGGQSNMNFDTSQTARYDHTSAYPIDSITEGEKNVVLNLVSCNICGRKFSDDRLMMHSKICAKNQGKKRKAYDMTKARTQGTDAEKFVRRKAFTRSQSPPTKKSDWRRKHNDFINTIRSAKLVSHHIAKGGKISDLPPPPPSENPDYVKCQYCQRRFNPAVAERHIPRCKDIKARPKPPKRK